MAEPAHSDSGTPNTSPIALNCPADQLGFAMVDVGEVALHVACRGTGPVIVLLHGYPGFYFSWQKLIDPLVGAGFRVVVPDLRGYNLSDKPSELSAYHVDHLVADIAGLISASSQSKVLLVAHDWGGVLAWIYASRYPDKLRGMVLMAAPHPDIWCRPEIDPVQAAAGDNYIPFIAGATGELAFATFDAMLGPYLSSAELQRYHEAWERPGAKAAMNNWYRANVYPEVKLPTDIHVNVATLALWGMQDTFVTPSQLDFLPRYADDLQIVNLTAMDHWLPLHMTELVLQKILEFERQRPR